MQLFVASDERFYSGDQGVFTYYTSGYSFWKRYLTAFSEVTVVARIRHENAGEKPGPKANGTGVTFRAIPAFDGLKGMLRHSLKLLTTLCRLPKIEATYILRMPGIVSTLVWFCLAVRQRPYAVEVVGDPYDSLSPEALGRSTLLVRWMAVVSMKLICRRASAAAYVTKQTLQKRYPSKAMITTHYSSLELPQELIAKATAYRHAIKWQPFFEIQIPPRLLFVGSLAQRYKGLHILLKALVDVRQRGIGFRLLVLGDGRYRKEYEELAFKLDLSEWVQFKGQLPRGFPVLREMSQADLLVMPSLVEGLPRAMLEAMACGLPCIGTTIGGIPELLRSEDMVSPNDAPVLADKLVEILTDPERLTQMSARNIEIASEYRADVLQARRARFYKQVAELQNNCSEK